MGSQNSTPIPATVNTLQNDSQTLEKGVETLQTTLQEFSRQFFPKEEVELKFSKVSEEQNTNNEKLNQLIDLGNEQQQVITDLGTKYAQLYEDYCKQQKMFVEMTGKYEDKFQRYEENLREARSKLAEVEKEIMSNSEITQVLGIRKSDNMIKKDKMSLRSHANKKTPEQPKPSQIETRSRGKERNAREKKYKEIPSISNPEILTKFDSADETNFLGTTITQKANQETLLELNNTL